jgi:hypothetical protein
MSYTKIFKILVVKLLIFSTPVRLDMLDFSVKETLNMGLKMNKNALILSSIMHQIYLGKLSRVINEIYIIFVATNRYWSGTLDI